jgi:hypothetical protein
MVNPSEQDLTYRNRTVRGIFLSKYDAKNCAVWWRDQGFRAKVYERSSSAEAIWFHVWVVVTDAG